MHKLKLNIMEKKTVITISSAELKSHLLEKKLANKDDEILRMYFSKDGDDLIIEAGKPSIMTIPLAKLGLSDRTIRRIATSSREGRATLVDLQEKIQEVLDWNSLRIPDPVDRLIGHRDFGKARLNDVKVFLEKHSLTVTNKGKIVPKK